MDIYHIISLTIAGLSAVLSVATHFRSRADAGQQKIHELETQLAVLREHITVKLENIEKHLGD